MNAYERDPYLAELRTRVVHCGKDDQGVFAVLADTIMYPEGGGQPADRGKIGASPVVDVQRVDDEIRHYLEARVVPGDCVVRLDWTRRFDHMQQHTAQHLITAVAAEELGWQTRSFHLGASTSDIELDVASIAAEELSFLEDKVGMYIRDALPVRTTTVAPAALEELGVRTRGLPAGHRGDVRVVEIEGVDRNACGGTHVAGTTEIESVVFLGTEPMRGGTRLYWVAGGRVRARLHQRERHAADVRRLFEGADEEVLELAAGKLAKLQEAERELKSLRASVAGLSAAALVASNQTVLDRHFDNENGAFLQLVSRELLALTDARPALLTASNADGSFFALCAPADTGLDLRELGAEAARLLSGRGGGSAEIVQGKASSLARRGEVVELLARALDRVDHPGSR